MTVDEILAGGNRSAGAPAGESVDKSGGGKEWDKGAGGFTRIVLMEWILTAACLAILGMLYPREDRLLAKIIAVVWLAALLLLIVWGTVRQYYKRKKNVGREMPVKESALLFWKRLMALFLPLVLGVCLAAAYLTFENWRIPAPLPAPYIDNVPESAEQVTLTAALEILRGEESSEMNPIGLERALLCLPQLLLASLLWGIVNLGGRLWLLRKADGRWSGSLFAAIGLMTLCAAVYAGGGSLLGSRYEQDRSVETEVFADQQEWDRFLSGYFQLYKSYSYYADQRGEEWPAITENTAVIDCRYLDDRLGDADRYNQYRGVIGLEAESRTVWRAASMTKRIANHLEWISAAAWAAAGGLFIFWGGWCGSRYGGRLFRRKRWKEEKQVGGGM